MDNSYAKRRSQLRTYFDETASETWARLTSDAPVSGIRRTVRAGRDRMRALLLSSLPANLDGLRVLDAGCGTGAGAIELAERGAEVVAIDISPSLVEIAAQRHAAAAAASSGSIQFHSGDMLDTDLGEFDHVLAMDSLIHYDLDDIVGVLQALISRVHQSIVFTFAPRTPLLALMHVSGRLIPHNEHRAPAIVPVAESKLRRACAAAPNLQGWQCGHSERISSGFYTSQSMVLQKSA